jgi:hypothetical protein
MPDNRKDLKDRLGKLGLEPRREEEILRELGDHLDDFAADREALGNASGAAAREALDSVSNWPELRNEIRSAETEEMNMNYRTKVLWLPALGALTLSGTLLALFQFFGLVPLVPRFYWLSNTGMSMHPFSTVYFSWLVALPLIGAVAAYWSQRAGGNAIHRLLAALAPSIGMLGMLGVFLIGRFISVLLYMLISLFGKGAAHTRAVHILHSQVLFLIGVVAVLVCWCLLPAVGLLLAAIPFLRKNGSAQSSVISAQ